ncbi:MAG: hypothetical protein U0802_16345 [Candidatus Binatia bacterium]
MVLVTRAGAPPPACSVTSTGTVSPGAPVTSPMRSRGTSACRVGHSEAPTSNVLTVTGCGSQQP